MDQQNRKAVITAVQVIAANCNQNIIDIKNLMKAWHIALSDVDDDQISCGLKKALERESGFMPSVGEFKQLCLSAPGVSSIEEEAKEQWALVVKNLNSYSNPIFKNAVIAEAIRKMGGWKKLCMMLESEVPFREKDFVSHYSVYKRRKGDYEPNVMSIDCNETLKYIGFDSHEEMGKALEKAQKKKVIENKTMKMLAGGGNE